MERTCRATLFLVVLRVYYVSLFSNIADMWHLASRNSERKCCGAQPAKCSAHGPSVRLTPSQSLAHTSAADRPAPVGVRDGMGWDGPAHQRARPGPASRARSAAPIVASRSASDRADRSGWARRRTVGRERIRTVRPAAQAVYGRRRRLQPNWDWELQKFWLRHVGKGRGIATLCYFEMLAAGT